MTVAFQLGRTHVMHHRRNTGCELRRGTGPAFDFIFQGVDHLNLSPSTCGSAELLSLAIAWVEHSGPYSPFRQYGKRGNLPQYHVKGVHYSIILTFIQYKIYGYIIYGYYLLIGSQYSSCGAKSFFLRFIGP
jgi:hypothetical protein